MTVKRLAKSMPPNRPWMPLKRTSISMSCAAPQSAEARTKPTIPASRNGLRPKRSPSFPEIGIMTVEVTR